MRNSLLTAIFLSSPLVCMAADTPFDVKPGLWEMTTTTQMSGMPPIPNLDQMTPEQRARIEGAMKRMAGAPHNSTQKECITKESIDKAIARATSNKNEACAPKLVSMTASKVTLHMDCTRQQNDAKSTGDIIIERMDSEHIKGTGTITSSGNGHTMDIKWSMTGAYLSSNCGGVKPNEQP
jgi:hypothetical protein